MKHICDYFCLIRDKLDEAKDFAEKSTYWKYEGNDRRQRQYHSMSEQDIAHAAALLRFATEDLGRIKDRGYKPTEEFEELWRSINADYVEKASWIKHMLEM